MRRSIAQAQVGLICAGMYRCAHRADQSGRDMRSSETTFVQSVPLAMCHCDVCWSVSLGDTFLPILVSSGLSV